MVFKKMMRAFGVGGPSVDTVLANPNTRPGLTLEGQVRIQGGDHDVTIEQIVEDVGYSEASHFYKLFKSAYGMTPAEYRESLGGH